MAEKLEDLNLPLASVTKLIKDALPKNVMLGKDTKEAISRAASVFVLYVTSQASQEAQRQSRKTLQGTDVIKALEELEFGEFIEPLQEVLKEMKETKEKKKASPKPRKSSTGAKEPEEEPMEADNDEH
ncbi:DNA polymerase epsilon subunit 3 [Anthonomus grandis grandis]|uniref:DNA polymerase epsilon subunit 3 n=1 Tax=Anthonomus grandis grandis TaxID=2921223 RepID=UPI002164F964|nr:DNA polymerase epsilon subunit 3 [Anthonomus grandis grandis]